MNIVELALNVECAAYDLYRTMAESEGDENTKKALLTVVQSEKGQLGQLRILADVLAISSSPAKE